jgi:5-methylcytosine-specific restriction protein B
MIESGEDEKTIFDVVTNNESREAVELNQELYKEIENQKRIEFITFHQSYSYEDFIEGFRPTEDGNIKLEDGIFKILAQKALDNKEQNYYIVIDEINRGNISKIFGELITLIEEDKRDLYAVTLPYSKEKFIVPSNLYIIATMNSTDKSIATIDIALRRRFTFLKMQPNTHLVVNEEAKRLMLYLNEYIEKRLGKDFLLGHSYFMGENLDLEFIKEYKIRPLLEEYFYSDDNLDIDKLLQGDTNDS